MNTATEILIRSKKPQGIKETKRTKLTITAVAKSCFHSIE